MAEISEVRQLPAEFIEALGKTYADELTKTVGGLKQIDVSKLYGPQYVAGPGALTTQAEQMASGLGAYTPYLQQAERLATGAEAALGTAAGDIAAARGMIGPSAYQQYMSPYQQDVIDTTLAEFDIQAQKGLPVLAQQAIAAGAFGGGREGVQRAEYQSSSDRNRAALQAQLLQQGFGQAQQLAQQAQAQRMGIAGAQAGLAGQQLGLGQFQTGLAQTAPALVGQQISALTGLGAQQQAREQAGLEAKRQLAYQQAYQPYQATQALGTGVMGLMTGYSPYTTRQEITPSPSGLSTALGTASTLAGIYNLVK